MPDPKPSDFNGILSTDFNEHWIRPHTGRERLTFLSNLWYLPLLDKTSQTRGTKRDQFRGRQKKQQQQYSSQLHPPTIECAGVQSMTTHALWVHWSLNTPRRSAELLGLGIPSRRLVCPPPWACFLLKCSDAPLGPARLLDLTLCSYGKAAIFSQPHLCIAKISYHLP